MEPTSPTGGGSITPSPQEALTAPPPTPDTSAATGPPTASVAGSTSTAVRWADEVGNATTNATAQAKEGATKMVGWTFENAKLETATSARGLRPMHVRVSVRVHHVSFLHPGLDNGGRATIGDRGKGRWRKKKTSKMAAPPGMMQFGSKRGNWKNPMSAKAIPFGMTEDGGGKNNAANKLRKDLESEHGVDNSDAAEIIAAEAFRLSRDGIIQHHYALQNASKQPQLKTSSTTTPKPIYSSYYPGSSRRLLGGKQKPSAPQSNTHPNILNPYSASNPQEAARYYKECAERPKGYRRLVVSSAVPTHDVPVPPPPTPTMHKMYSGLPSSGASVYKSGRMTTPRGLDAQQQALRSSTSSWGILQANEEDLEKDKKKNGKDESLFDNVEYQYIGPPQTGPEFFQLLRHHGAATFGRYLPELACSVPDHSIGFEVRKAKSKKRCASTQPLVVEAPHIIWGDARDKMLSKIAKEGCPLIDSRKFEYVSNARLDEAELSESLMVCGATLWVQNAPDEEGSTISTTSTLKPNYTKAMVKAEYYGGKFVDGMKDGLSVGIHVAEKGTKKMVKGTKDVVKGTKDVVKGTKGLLPIPDDRELESSMATTQAPTHDQSEAHRPRKRDKLKSMFNPKKVGQKLRRRSGGRRRGSGDDGSSVEGSIHSVGSMDHSVGSEGVATDSGVAADVQREAPDTAADAQSEASYIGLVGETKEEAAVDEGFDTDASQDKAVKTSEEKLEEEFTVVKPVPYVLLLDDIIDIRIVSFPDKDDVIAHFPISVASVMVQRSMEDRTEDPLKPSELTATLIQEPNAHDLRWGVELKVTFRAVEVKPNIPKVVPRPKDVIDEEMHKMKERLKMLGKKPEDIRKDLKAKEDENDKEENDLNGAIIAYGYGKGENEGVGMNEVRLRQMFYCEREHVAATHKMKRRSLLTSAERDMIKDARIDPSCSEKRGSYSGESLKKLMELLEVNFPGIEDEETAADEGASPNTGEVFAKGCDSVKVMDSFVNVSLAMAKSLDNCLGDLVDMPTVPAVNKQLHNTISEGIKPHISKVEAKEWCSKVAEKLSTHVNAVNSANATNVGIKSSVAKIQSIIAASALGSGTSFGDSTADEAEEETKLDEDEIAMSETKPDSQTDDLDSGKLIDWVNAVSSQLAACAEELDDGQESLALSDIEGSTTPMKEEGASLGDLGISSNTIDTSFSGYEGDIERSGLAYRRNRPKPPMVSRGSSSSYDGDIEVSGVHRPKRILPIASPDQSLSTSAGQRKESDSDGALWDTILSQKGRPKKSFSDSGVRHRSAVSISTVKDALPRSNISRQDQIEPLLKIAKKSHVHQVKTQTSSLSTTLVYLALITTIFIVGIALLFQTYRLIWSMIWATS